MVMIPCSRCGGSFNATPWSIRRYRRRFCSAKCQRGTPAERLNEKVRVTGDCWEFTGHITWRGYGQIVNEQGRLEHAHRLSYRLHGGVIPAGMLVCHRCDNRACVNPAHLFLGTAADNSADMLHKGRHRVPRGNASPISKVTEAEVRQIRHLCDNRIMSQRAVAAKFGISKGAVSHIATRRDWKHVA